MEVDWNEKWKEALEGSTWGRLRHGEEEVWDKEDAERYSKGNVHNEIADVVIGELDVRSGDAVLDIGSGPGTFSIPLARTVGQVTAVEPSKWMLYYLEKNCSAAGLSNIRSVNKKWEDVVAFEDVHEHDVVVAAYSLSMMEMKAALSKLDLLAKRLACVVTGAGGGMKSHQDLWFKLHGEVYQPHPDYIFIYNILYQLGIRANVSLSDVEYSEQYLSVEEAAQRWMRSLRADSRQREQIIRPYLEDNLIEEDGAYWFHNGWKSATIWWKKGP